MHTETLQQLGLPKNEAKIFEALLELGQANVSVIANTAKVNRRNVYDSLKNLIKRRLVTRAMGQREQLYQAQNPENLENILNQGRISIARILPELKKLYTSATPKEQISISKGVEGTKNFWNYVLSQKEMLYFIGGKGNWHTDHVNEPRKNFYSILRKKGLDIQGIFDYEVLKWGKEVLKEYDPKLLRVFPKEYVTNSSYYLMCGDRISLYPYPSNRSDEHLIIFNIISKSLTDSYRTWFKFLWEHAIPVQKFL